MSIHLILGSMFSGKSTELLRMYRRFKIAGKRCALIKYGKDTRYSVEEAVTHDKVAEKAIPALTLGELSFEPYDIICIDEGQFFPDIVEVADDLANKGKNVIIAALDGDYHRKQFNRFLDLVAKAEKVDKLTAICMACKAEASFTHHFAPISGDSMIDIGGAEKYVSLCRKCFIKNNSM